MTRERPHKFDAFTLKVHAEFIVGLEKQYPLHCGFSRKQRNCCYYYLFMYAHLFWNSKWFSGETSTTTSTNTRRAIGKPDIWLCIWSYFVLEDGKQKLDFEA